MTPTWWSEPVAATGSAKSAGIRRQLGAPRMDRLTVLVRESAQNSWDARVPGSGPVDYRIDVVRPDAGAMQRWRSLLCPEPAGSELGITRLLDSGDLVLAVIGDRGTTGLGGPLRADEARAGEPADFVNLLRNVGEPRERRFNGGTYGFGKGVLFTSSTIGTILVRTRCRVEDGFQTRLMGAALGDGFHREHRMFTGRHWWADTASGVPDPLLDQDADEVGARLGLPPMGAGETGTDIVVVGLDLGSAPASDDGFDRPRSVEQAVEHLASAMMWNLWPLLLADEEPARLCCRVTIDGTQIPVPHPDQEPCIRPFVDAYRAAGRQPKVIRRIRPKTDLGVFAACTHVAPTRIGRAAAAAPFTGNAHHCARMRQPRLIVDYLEGPPLADDLIHYGAVFIADRVHDEAFAQAEPPTHDDWVAQNLDDVLARNLVAYANRQIRAELAAFVDRIQEPAATGGRQPPLGALSNRLAALIPTAVGPGADGVASGGGGGGPGTAARVRMITRPRMIRDGGAAMIVADVEVTAASQPVEIVATANVAVDLGSEEEPPAGAPVPHVVGFRSGDGTVRSGDRLVVASGDERRWTVLVRPVAGAATRLRVSAS